MSNRHPKKSKLLPFERKMAIGLVVGYDQIQKELDDMIQQSVVMDGQPKGNLTGDPTGAAVMRRERKKRGIKKLKVVYSKEEPLTPMTPENETCEGDVSGADDACASVGNVAAGSQMQEFKAAKRRATPGSTAFVPSAAGLLIASEVVKDLIGR